MYVNPEYSRCMLIVGTWKSKSVYTDIPDGHTRYRICSRNEKQWMCIAHI